MKDKELTELTEQELIIEEKKQKQIFYFFNGVIGFMIGVAIYSFLQNGFSFFTFFPLFFIPIAIFMGKNYKAIKKEIEKRNTK